MEGSEEYFEQVQNYHKEKTASNRKNSRAILEQHPELLLQTNNDGVHFIVTNTETDIVADFWPGTGKYKLRNSRKYKRGVFNLLKDLHGRRSI